MIDRKRVLEEFASYTHHYNPKDFRIAIKIKHTYKVAENCERIAKSLNMSDDEVDIAWLIGMLHDIGRFEQIKRYHTFSDIRSVDHAELGVEVLYGEDGIIGRFIDNVDLYDGRDLYDTVRIAIAEHNRFRVETEIKDEEHVFCDLIRDADKDDIFRISYETPKEELFETPEDELFSMEVTDKVMEDVRNHSAILRPNIKVPIDRVIGHMALCFELVFPEARKIALEQGYLEKMFSYPFKSKTALEAVQIVKDTIHSPSWTSS